MEDLFGPGEGGRGLKSTAGTNRVEIYGATVTYHTLDGTTKGFKFFNEIFSWFRGFLNSEAERVFLLDVV